MISLVKKFRRGRNFYLKLQIDPAHEHLSNKLNIRVFRVRLASGKGYSDPNNHPNRWGITKVEDQLSVGTSYSFKLKLSDVPEDVKKIEIGLVEEGVTWHYRVWVEL